MTKTVWDPFEGEVPFAAPTAEALAKPPRAKRATGAVGVIVILAGFVFMLVEWIFFPDIVIRDFPVISTAIVTLGFGMVLLTSDDDGEGRTRAPLAAGIAAARGWSFQPVKQRSRRSGGADGLGGGVTRDPAMEPAYAAIGPLLNRAVTPVNPQALLRGQAGGRDLWIGIEEMSSVNRAGQGLGESLTTAMSGGAVALRAVIGVRLAARGRFAVELAVPVRVLEGDGPEIAVLEQETALTGPLNDLGAERLVLTPEAVFVNFPGLEPVDHAEAWLDQRLAAVLRVAQGIEE